MSEIKIRETALKEYAAKLGNKGKAVEYLPMKVGNMAYSQANSINHFRTAMFDLVDAVDAFQGVVETDALRLKELGLSFTNKDRELERTMGLEVK
ncbi:type VII secretion effector [Listeria ivanovii subsp. londoniensis]|uniref:DUF3130 domain-containing protein n=2 Tax=Listeria ivanovii TaxID=1638 RepID=A0ABS1G219_LISIV|nr:DUF3130 domain-containing protein [Listeria ivanovii]AIS58569.1 hypothetical protein JL58_00550 [Listeria ivanovii subsp. londoniensis]MBK1960907.1 DUF3130 domain-containing protein [Listeria ivanovii subsp. londoniensis]MBK2003225.1 DUF3130 domain-containing protein [Listeria ivanovii subsp. londoniensis]SDW06066.1 type VII secretion effector, SACOL2603 family [Listeria ivanovii]VEH44518.1 type VII secretion effector [Listeria ivanovii subsp. londoniensis]